MNNPKIPNSQNTTSANKKTSETESEIEPLHPESGAKKDKKFVSVESKQVKKKKSVPPDSTAQRGKSLISTSEEKEKRQQELVSHRFNILLSL